MKNVKFPKMKMKGKRTAEGGREQGKLERGASEKLL